MVNLHIRLTCSADDIVSHFLFDFQNHISGDDLKEV